MKKIVLLTTIFVLALTLGAYAERTVYWDDFLDTAQIIYGNHQGEISYYIQPFEFINGLPAGNGIANELNLHYGIAPRTEINATFGLAGPEAGVYANLKNQIVNSNGYAFGLKGQVDFYKNDLGSGLTPSVSLLFDNNTGRPLEFHNTVSFALAGNNLRIGLNNGIYYRIDSRSGLKAKLVTNFNNLDNIHQGLAIAYRVLLSDNLAYNLVFARNFYSANNQFQNIFEYKPVNSLKLTGDLIINTDNDHYYNFLLIRADKAMANNFSIIGEYQTALANKGYSSLRAGIDFKF